MNEPSLNEKQLAELNEILEIARITEEKARELYEMATLMALKCQIQDEIREAGKHPAGYPISD